MAMAADDIGALDALSAALSPGPTAMLAGGPIGQAQAAFSALLSSNFIDEAVGAAHAGWYRGERNETLLLSDTGPQVVDPATGQMTSDRSAERSEEHTSELQSLMRSSYAVFCLKKKQRLTDDDKHHKQPEDKKRPID